MHDQSKKKPLLIIANWKMQLTHTESTAFFAQYRSIYEELLVDSVVTLVICPSFTVLPFVTTFPVGRLRWGAQNCSFELRGAYTGDISVLSLKELGISYVIIGHSEQRQYHKETDESVARKADLLFFHSVHPIMCIGETEKEYRAGLTFIVLEKQLRFLRKLRAKNPEIVFIIAYEPVWAIGTGVMPVAEELKKISIFITEYIGGERALIKILYGGSVSLDSIALFSDVDLDGYLLGKPSIDGETLKKIILL
ncbi:triosephosphate isomerase [Candidatus Dependentiae bacterium]|nr:triosephosphate isomerase [Candidatus Dependentiae bacterium]